MASPLRDVLLVVRGFAGQARALRPHLALLGRQLGPAVVRIDAHYRTGADVGMFLTRLDLRAFAAPAPLAALADRMRTLGGEMIDLEEVGQEQAERLRERILPRCEIVCREVAGLAEAVDALLAALGV